LKTRLGSPGIPMPGYQVKLLDDQTGEELTQPNQKGVLTIEGPLPPGCLQTIWGDDQRFVQTYWRSFAGKLVYNTFDWGIRDEDGYYFILGRTDDVINVAGHRLGTREIEEAVSSHAGVAEVAVVGVADALKGQVPMAFVVPKNAADVASPDSRQALQAAICRTVDEQLGALARPARIVLVSTLPKTRSGKLLRRTIQAVCEGRDTGDLSTLDDPGSLAQLKASWDATTPPV
jgi:propionyl-CoA synthetase